MLFCIMIDINQSIIIQGMGRVVPVILKGVLYCLVIRFNPFVRLLASIFNHQWFQILIRTVLVHQLLS